MKPSSTNHSRLSSPCTVCKEANNLSYGRNFCVCPGCECPDCQLVARIKLKRVRELAAEKGKARVEPVWENAKARG